MTVYEAKCSLGTLMLLCVSLFILLSTTETNCHCPAATNCLRRSSPKEDQRPTAATQQPPTVSGDNLPKKVFSHWQYLTNKPIYLCSSLGRDSRNWRHLRSSQPPSTSRKLSPHPSRPQYPTDMTNPVDC